MSNKKDGVLYIGVTSNLVKRVYEHKHKIYKGFTEKYNLFMLVWFETHETMEEAIIKEKKMKKWNRTLKIDKILSVNPTWEDLYETIV